MSLAYYISKGLLPSADTFEARSSSMTIDPVSGGSGYQEITAQPWGRGIATAWATGFTKLTEQQLNNLQLNATSERRHIGALQAAYGVALSRYANARDALAPAEEAYAAGEVPRAALVMALKAAETNLATLQGRYAAAPPTVTDAEVAAAQTRYQAALADAENFINPGAAQRDAAQEEFAEASDQLQGNPNPANPDAMTPSELSLHYYGLNLASFNKANPDPEHDSSNPYIGLGPGSSGNAISVVRYGDGGQQTGYLLATSQYQYRRLVAMTTEVRDGLIAARLQILVRWSEVTTMIGGGVVGADGNLQFQADQTTKSYFPVQEIFDPADGVLQGDQITYRITGVIRDIPPATPSLNLVSNTAVLGVPIVPATNPYAVQYQGAERWRQGWPEYQTPEYQQQPARYLTLTASNGPGTPMGTRYEGTLALVPVPPGGFGSAQKSIYESYDPLTRPLVILDTLSEDCGAGRPLPGSLVPDTEGATLENSTTRTMSSPPGLRLTLGDPQTAADIQGAVNTIVAQDWPRDVPDNPPPGFAYPPDPPRIAFNGAINYSSPDGDHEIRQKMRFKLSYSAGDKRPTTGTSFSTTHHWALRKRDLLTGEVTVKVFDRTVRYPRVVQTTSPGGNVSYSYYYNQTDAAWTEVEADPNQSVELLMLPGENAAPYTFGDVGVELVF